MFECFHMWDIINSIARNTGVCVSFQVSIFTFSGYVPRSRIAGSYGCPIFRFLWKLHTDFHSGWINNLHCPRVFKWFLFPYPLKLLIFTLVIALVIGILTDVSWYCIIVLICLKYTYYHGWLIFELLIHIFTWFSIKGFISFLTVLGVHVIN